MRKRIFCSLLSLAILLSIVALMPLQVSAASEMTSSDSLITVLKALEGFSATPYWDYAQWTVGYGTKCPDDKLTYYQTYGITEAEAQTLLKNALTSFESELNNFIDQYNLKLSQNQFDALVSFTYNCGGGWMRETTGYFNNAVRSGATGSEFIYAICLYSSAGGDYILMNRRMCEANIYLNGVYNPPVNGTYTYPENYRWVFLDGNGGTIKYVIYGYDAADDSVLSPTVTAAPSGGTLTGWYTEDGIKVTTLDSSLEKGEVLYAKWVDSNGKVISSAKGEAVDNLKVTVTGTSVNVRNGPGTYYPKIGAVTRGEVLTITAIYKTSSYTWGKTGTGWVSLDYTNYGSGVQIIQQPTDTSAASGQKVKISVTATGSGLSYQWYVAEAGINYFHKSSITTDTYTTTMDESRDGRTVYCIVTDSSGNVVKSDSATMTMDNTLYIKTQPQSVTVENGKQVKFTLEANGVDMKYQWYVAYAGSENFIKSSIVYDTYTTTMDADRDGRRVYCEITDAYGNTVRTNTVTMTMDKSLVITKQPQSVSVRDGQPVTISVSAVGSGLTYQWYVAAAGSSYFHKSSITTDTYTTIMDDSRNGRAVYCVITSSAGISVKTDTVTMTMDRSLVITKQPTDVTVVRGQTANITVEAEGDGLTYQWYFAVPGGNYFHKSSVTTDTYTTVMDDSRDGRQVYCLITDAYGNTVKSNTVYMYIDTNLAITKQPAAVTVANGETVNISLTAVGKGLSYQWYVALPGQNYFHKSTVTTDTYITTMDSSRDGRSVYCIVTDYAGNTVRSDTVTMTMSKNKELAITKQPANTSVVNGGQLTISLTAVGDGLSYQWYVAEAGINYFHKSSITTDTYITTMDAARDGRSVYCVITDAYGNTVQSDTVTMTMVKITRQPASVIVSNGKQVSISLTATGEGITYQWYVAVAGVDYFHKSSITTNTYTTTMDGTRNGRRVYCIITDAYGNTIQSDTVTMTMK